MSQRHPHFDNDTPWVWDPHLLQELQNDDASDSEIAKMTRSVATFIAVLFIGYLILGLTGNFLTILALLRCPRVRNVTAAFIISLCVADFLFCVLVLPWEISRFLAGRWVWGEGWICTLFPLLRYWNVAASLLSIAMITINRYIMIAHFSVYKVVYRKVCIAIMIAFCWLFAFVMLLPTLLGKWGRFGFDRRLQTCSIIDDDNMSPKQVLFGLGFCVPAIIIVICYSLIFIVIHKSEKRMRHHSSRGRNGVQGPGLQVQSRHSKVEKEARRKRNEWRITKMVLIIFIAFLFTYLPITLVKNLDKRVDYPGLHVAGYVLIYVSCCINPVIYVIMNRQYRQAYKTVLLCKRPRLPSLTSSHSEPHKGVPCRRYASIQCNSCMSHGSLRCHDSETSMAASTLGQTHANPKIQLPLHTQPTHTRPYSLHDVLYTHKNNHHQIRLGIHTPDRRSIDTICIDTTKLDCSSCQNPKKKHQRSCFKCKTTMNTKRNSRQVVLHDDLLSRGKPKGGLEQKPGEKEFDSCPEPFLDHLLNVELSAVTGGCSASSSRSQTPEPRKNTAHIESKRGLNCKKMDYRWRVSSYDNVKVRNNDRESTIINREKELKINVQNQTVDDKQKTATENREQSTLQLQEETLPDAQISTPASQNNMLPPTTISNPSTSAPQTPTSTLQTNSPTSTPPQSPKAQTETPTLPSPHYSPFTQSSRTTAKCNNSKSPSHTHQLSPQYPTIPHHEPPSFSSTLRNKSNRITRRHSSSTPSELLEAEAATNGSFHRSPWGTWTPGCKALQAHDNPTFED